jgi:hypothetical protein
MTLMLFQTVSAVNAIPDLSDWAPMVSSMVALAAVITSYFATRKTLENAAANTEKAAWQKANEAEVTFIQARLDAFFGPLRTMSDVNRLMNRDLRDRQRDGAHFLLIEKLFDTAWRESLPAGEVTLLAEIAATSEKLRTFIENNAGKVDEQLLPYLSRAAAHYRMIELAHAGKLGDEPKPFVARYVFPRQVEDVLRLEVQRLEKRRDWLRTHPFEAATHIEPLVIPEDLALPQWPNPPRAPRPELNMPMTQ